MALSESARHVLAEAAQHPLRLAEPPDKLPAAACRSELNSRLKQGYIEECEAPEASAGLRRRRQDSTRPAVCVTEAGMAAIRVTPPAAAMLPDTAGTGTAAASTEKRRSPAACCWYLS